MGAGEGHGQAGPPANEVRELRRASQREQGRGTARPGQAISGKMDGSGAGATAVWGCGSAAKRDHKQNRSPKGTANKRHALSDRTESLSGMRRQ